MPYKFSKIYTALDPHCWRHLGELDTFPHILWSCKLIKPFWTKVVSLISELSNTICSPDPALSILHMGLNQLLPIHRTVVIQLLIAAIQNIMKLWKSRPNLALLIRFKTYPQTTKWKGGSQSRIITVKHLIKGGQYG